MPVVVGRMHYIVAELVAAAALVWLNTDLLESRQKHYKPNLGVERMESRRMWLEALVDCHRWIAGGDLTAVVEARIAAVGTVVVVENWFGWGPAWYPMRCEALGPFVECLAAVHVAVPDPQHKRALGRCGWGTVVVVVVAVDEAVHFVRNRLRRNHVELGQVGHIHMIVMAGSLMIREEPHSPAEL